ncbi:MAG: MBL fold metallo-hydrolase, partial [Nevskiales bacterium]
MHELYKPCLAVLLACVFTLAGCSGEKEGQFEQLTTPEALAEHSKEFRKGIEGITDGVWIAIGYGLANSILVEGDDGLIVIDTMETLEEGKVVAEEFRKLSDKPLKAIIYTHNHTDHVFGAQAFIEVLGQEGTPVEVYAHQDTEYYVNRIVSEYRPIITARSFRMFGTHLDEHGLVNDGIGPHLSIDENSNFGFVKPTITLGTELDAVIAGEKFKLVHAPGETNDQIFVWMPEKQVLAVGDNLYKTFPNLYTIRGTPYRSLKQWAQSIDKMRALPVAHIAPSHTRPLHGEEEIQRVLTNYRDAIRFVYDQTVRWMNAGLTPDEIVERVKLPEHLATEP